MRGLVMDGLRRFTATGVPKRLPRLGQRFEAMVNRSRDRKSNHGCPLHPQVFLEDHYEGFARIRPSIMVTGISAR